MMSYLHIASASGNAVAMFYALLFEKYLSHTHQFTDVVFVCGNSV